MREARPIRKIRGRGIQLLIALACLGLHAGCEVVGPSGGPEADSNAILRLNQANFLVSEASSPPPTSADWRAVSLPDDWRAAGLTDVESAWYRFDVPAAVDPSGPRAIYLPRVNMTAEIWVGGQSLGPSRTDGPLPNDFNRPLFFTLPGSLSADESSVIYLRLRRHAYHYGSLGPIEVGTHSALEQRYRRAHLYQIEFARFATALVVLAALFAGTLWIATKRDPVYGTFAWTAACCAVASLNYWVRDLPVDRWLWERLIHASLSGFAVGVALWSRRLLNLSPSRVDRFLRIYLSATTGLILLLPIAYFYPGVNYVNAASSAVAIYAGVLVLRNAGELLRGERAFYALGALMGVVFCVHDLALQFGHFSDEEPFVFIYVMPLIVTIFAASLIVRFRASLERVENMNQDLERRVSEKAQELSANHERLRELERERVLLLERERLTREMHDGLGGQLVSTLALVESAPTPSKSVAIALRTALADLRTVIDSLDPRIDDFGMLFGLLRGRIAPLFDAEEVEIGWHVGDLPPRSELGPENHLHVLRILQEAFSNAVRHANASRIDFSADWTDDLLKLRVEDDGIGLGTSTVTGRGLPNMKARAKAMGAELSVTDRRPGTRVELRLRVSG